jgi:Protein of unknown function (DUF1552)
VKFHPRTRRAFLQGAGGSLLAIPLLPSLLPRAARAQAAGSGPSRFVFVGAIWGRDIKAWYPAQDPTQQSPDGAYYQKLSEVNGPLSYILSSAFDGLRNKFSILRGLDCMQPGDAHMPTVPLTASGWVPSGVGFGYSLDVVLEESKRFYPVLPMVPALRTCPNATWDQLSFSFSSSAAPKQQPWHEWDPRVVYEKYFDPTNVAKSARQAVYKRGVVNKVMEDYRRVMSSSVLGREDKHRLDNYLSLLSSAEARLGVAPVSCARGTNPVSLANNDALHSAAIDLEVAALACGMTRIVCHNVLQVSTAADGTDVHLEAHTRNKSTPDPAVSWHAVHNRWVMNKVAEFMSKLDSVQEGSGTLLDDTIFLHGNADGHGFHIQMDMPVLVAGGGGKLRTGYYIDYRPRPLNVIEPINQLVAGRPYNHLLITLFKALGFAPDEYQRFGLPGFGIYDQFNTKLSSHYDPFMRSPNASLPFLES